MTTPRMSAEQTHATLKALEQALFYHEDWAQALHGALICRLEPDPRDLDPDAHHLCQFGQWYCGHGIAALEQHPDFIEIGVSHEQVHQNAARLLRQSLAGAPIPIADYRSFVAALKRFREAIAIIQHELEDVFANLDPLTGTPNRAGMLGVLREQKELVKRKVHPCCVAMFDLDHFKRVNDKYGHAVGDRVLIAIAQHAMAHLRPYDKIFRYGGEEFVVCLPDADLQVGYDIVDRLREQLAELPHTADGAETFHVTVSFGLTLLDPDIPVEQSIDRADKALYAAKAGGRNRAVTWDASMKMLQT